MLHEVAANLLLGLPVEYDLTDEQREVVDTYVDFVRSLPGEKLIEQGFKLPHHDEFWGTCDAIAVDGSRIVCVDLKAGRGVAVEVDYNGRINPQLGMYLLGAMSRFPDREFTDIEMVIVQPRFGGIKRRAVAPHELQELVEEMLSAAQNALGENPRYEAGSHCKFCLARATCPTLRGEVFRLAKMDFDDV